MLEPDESPFAVCGLLSFAEDLVDMVEAAMTLQMRMKTRGATTRLKLEPRALRDRSKVS